MRILRLDLGSSNGTVDFHPFVSIIHGLDDVKRELLVSSLRSLVRGTTSGLSGLVESNGELIELATASGEVLGPFTTEDVVVAVDTVQLGEQNEATLRAELDQLRRKAESAAVHVEEIRADLDPTALISVQHLRQELAGTTPITAAELLRNTSARDVQTAINRLSGVQPVIFEARAEVAGVVSRWNEYKQAEVEAASHIAHLDRKVKDGEAGYRRVSDALEDAKRRAVPRVLSPLEDARVEELAEISFDRRGRRAKKRSESEEAELANLLGKVGQSTHAAYAMYRIAPTADPAALAEVDRAKQSVERASYKFEESKASYTNDPIAVELAGQMKMLKEEARLHLGPMLPADLGAALLALRDESDNPEFLTGVTVLYDALKTAGARVDDSVESVDLVGWATEWILASQVEPEIEQNSADRADLESKLQNAEVSLDRHVRAMARIDRMEAAAAESEGHASDVEDRLAVANGEGGVSKTDLITSIGSLADRIRSDAGSAAPLILVGDFNTLADTELDELLSDLEGLAQGVQLIVVTDRDKAASWASKVGLRRALRSTVIRVGA